MILRELIARLALDFDRSGFDAADQRINSLTRGLEFAGTAAIALGGALAVGIGFGVKAAADANETLNLMGLVFERNAGQVQEWAAATAEAAGRSEFALREMATRIGSFLKPMLGDLDQSTDLAQRLSERAIDFASAMNIADTEAIEKFQAGLAGETEPLRRFGVNMTVAALEAFRLEQGISKSVSTMDDAEKTQLRFAFLMQRTADFQNDAANTSESFANATKGLFAAAGDLGTRLGMRFLPAAEAVVRTARDVIQVLGEWVEHSNIVQAAIITFGTIATAIAIRTAAAWAIANWPIVLAGLALAALVLIVDDFLTFLRGGDSVIGAFIDSIWGPGSAAEAAQGLRTFLDDLAYAFTDILFPAAEEAAQGLIQWFGDMFTSIGDWVIENQNALLGYAAWVEKVSARVVNAISDLIDAFSASSFTFDSWQTLASDSFGAVSRALSSLKASVADFLSSLPDSIRSVFGVQVTERLRRGDPPGALALGGVAAPPPTAAVPPAIQAMSADNSSSSMSTINQSVSVTVPESTGRGQAREVATTAASELRRMHRAARAGTTQRAEG